MKDGSSEYFQRGTRGRHSGSDGRVSSASSAPGNSSSRA